MHFASTHLLSLDAKYWKTFSLHEKHSCTTNSDSVYPSVNKSSSLVCMREGKVPEILEKKQKDNKKQK